MRGAAAGVAPEPRRRAGDAARRRGYSATDRGGLRVRATLLAVQVALSVTLLVVTGLFVTSFVQLLRVDPGFSPERVVAVEIAPVASRYSDVKARAALYDRILTATRDVSSVTSAAWTSALPLTGETWVDARQHDALRQHLHHEPPAAGAERGADRNLFLSRRRPREQEVREVGADYQNHHRDRAREHPDRRADAAADLFRQRLHVALKTVALRVFRGDLARKRPDLARALSAETPGFSRPIIAMVLPQRLVSWLSGKGK